MARSITIARTSAIRGISYRCPRCNKNLPATALTISLTKVIVQAQCEPCRLVVGREFTLAGRTISDLLTGAFLKEDKARAAEDTAFDRALGETK